MLFERTPPELCTTGSFAAFLDTPQFLSSTLHIITLTGLPIHVFGAMCIVFRTPPQMANMKWVMLNLHIWSVALDVTFGFLVVPFTYEPVLAGYPLGVLAEFGVDMKYQYYLCVVLVAGVLVSVAVLFETRFFVLYARDSFWRHLRCPWLIINYLIAFTFMLPTYFMIPEQVSGKRYQFGRYPCMPDEVYDEKVFLLSTWSSAVGYNSNLNTAGEQALVFMILIYWNMRKSMSRIKLSKKTLEMQRSVLRALILQVTIPLVIVLGPLIYNTLATLNSYYNQGANNLSVSVMATHGIVSSLAMIYLHKSVRQSAFAQPTVSVSVASVSIIQIFENRLLVLQHEDPWWRRFRVPWFLFNYLVALLIFLPSYLLIPDQSEAKSDILGMLPRTPDYLDIDRIFVVSAGHQYLLWPGFLGFCLYTGQIGTCACLIEKCLSENYGRKMSLNTLKLHRKFQKALVIPLIIVCLPVLYLGFSGLFRFHYQFLNNISI
ncbi:unnamed protein product [Caenorhabditis sp. 36 PRJEB53466]|nr:unnamed protein product [Caenorhabditis sp. 36 PRJEB53466]